MRLRPAFAASLLAALALPSAVLIGSAAVEAPAAAIGAAATADPTATPTQTGTPAATVTTTVTAAPTPDGPVTVDDAQLRWGINDESNNAAFAPGTYNFFSAGEVRDPGAGGQRLPVGGTGSTWSNGRPAGWTASAGDVRIEKRRSDGSYAAATFAGTSTDAAGDRLTTGGSTFSDHQVVIDGGTGTVDPAAGTASVRWDGTFTVLYYSGMTFFTVSDPQLVVTPTSAQLRGTLGGYASDMVDTSRWVKVPGQQVVLADLPRSTLDLPGEGGFSATPSYLGVRYDAPADGVTQVRSGASWGAFPASFLTSMQRIGSAAYWYSSGGSADAHKVPQPLTVSYSAADPVEPSPDPDPTGSADDPADDPTQSVAPTPSTSTPTPAATPTPPAASARPAQPAGVVPPTAAVTAAAPPTFDPRLPAIPVVTARTAPTAARPTSSGHPWEWWTGSLLLLGAAAISTLSTVTRRVKGKS